MIILFILIYPFYISFVPFYIWRGPLHNDGDDYEEITEERFDSLLFDETKISVVDEAASSMLETKKSMI